MPVLITILRDGFAYAVLIHKVLNNDLSIDNFILSFAAVGSFAGLVGGILSKFSEINQTSLTLCDLRDYIDYPEKENRGEGVKLPPPGTRARLSSEMFPTGMKAPKKTRCVTFPLK